MAEKNEEILLLLNNQMKNMSQSSKSSVTLGAVWWTLTLAEEPQGPRRTVIFYIYTLTNYYFER